MGDSYRLSMAPPSGLCQHLQYCLYALPPPRSLLLYEPLPDETDLDLANLVYFRNFDFKIGYVNTFVPLKNQIYQKNI